jgi:hypothetical protein
VLWVTGSEGIGKSLLAFASMRHLSSLGDEHSSVASFFFKEDVPVLQSAQNSMACQIVQLAETNTRFAEHMQARLQEDSDVSKGLETWQRFFLVPFADSSHSANLGRLYLVFDGLDETHEEQRKVILTFLADLMKQTSRVHVLVTSRLEVPPALARIGCPSISITKTKMLNDIKLVIRDQLRRLPRLNRFSTATKKAILKRVAAKADGGCTFMFRAQC